MTKSSPWPKLLAPLGILLAAALLAAPAEIRRQVFPDRSLPYRHQRILESCIQKKSFHQVEATADNEVVVHFLKRILIEFSRDRSAGRPALALFLYTHETGNGHPSPKMRASTIEITKLQRHLSVV